MDFQNDIIVHSVVSGACRCCLKEQDDTFLGLWDQHLYDGNLEVYGEMITQCFLMPWSQSDDPETNVEQICMNCVLKAREAFTFKKQMMIVEENLAHQFEIVKDTESGMKEVNSVNNEEHLEYSIPEYQQGQVLDECDDDKHGGNNVLISQPANSKVSENLVKSMDLSDTEYENVEYIEEEFIEMGNGKPEKEQQEKRKWPKRIRKKKGEQMRPYRNYSQKNMSMAVQCAINGTLKNSEAAAMYGVPRKTVDAIVRKYRSQPLDQNMLEPVEDIGRVKMKRFIEEIMTILTYTNSTPYKTTTSSYGCVYCTFVLKSTEFRDPEELRVHTRVKHASERLQAVEEFMRPYTSNEIIKLDIYHLVCTICCEAITGWMEMFEHLHKVHDVVLDEAYTRVIPYVLDFSNYKCAICKDRFHNYHHLDTHMNCHYNNYVCAECGDTFISKIRLTKHIQVHSTTRFCCDYPNCGKVFTLEKYMKKHYILVHTKEKHVKCQYCSLKFHDVLEKHIHIVECHKEKVTYITCDLCGKVFDWKPSYYAHMRKKHNDENALKCKYCDVLFTSKISLKKHMKTHADITNHCIKCKKTYSSKLYLEQHNWKFHETETTSLVEIQNV